MLDENQVVRDGWTAEQEAVVSELFEQYGEKCEATDSDDGVVFRTDDGEQELLVREDGAVSELETSTGSGVSTGEAASSPSEAAQEDSLAGPPATTSTDISVVNDPVVFQALTDADERQIMAEIEGKALGAMVYSFKQGGGNVTGLSWKGVQEAVRQMNTRHMGRIRIDSKAPVFEEITVDVDSGSTDDDGQPILEQRRAVRVTVYAIDEVYGSGRYGTATQTRHMRTSKRDKQKRWIWQADAFADTKALSKAQRNAMEGMLPLELVEELKAAYLGKGSVQYINATAVDVTDMPPALADEKAKALGDEIRALYSEYKRADENWMNEMPPKKFNQLFNGVQHDHGRLEDFKGYMEQQLAEAKETANA